MNNVQKAAIAMVANLGEAREKRDAPKANQPSPIGTDLGTFERNPCGECWHWKRVGNGILDQGTCMAGPPTAFPIQAPDGRMGQALTRPVLSAAHEGCDEWDDAPLEDDDGGGKIAKG
jgi:hypothetical protein